MLSRYTPPHPTPLKCKTLSDISFAACSNCWSSRFQSLITNNEFLPANEYLALSRKASDWSSEDLKRQNVVVSSLTKKMPSDLAATCFGMYFPAFVGAVCNPDGFNYHPRTHNDNGKCIIEYLLKSSLGLCCQLNIVYHNILVCDQNYFKVHRTTHTKGQPQSRYNFTSDVIAMSFQSTQELDAIYWMTADSPKTPKCIIADAEKSSDVMVIDEKMRKLQPIMMAYAVDSEVLGLVLGGNLVLRASLLKNGEVQDYEPLNKKDLSEVEVLAHVMTHLNMYFHQHCHPMTTEMRMEYQIVRSRSGSVASDSSSTNHSHYDFRPCPKDC